MKNFKLKTAVLTIACIGFGISVSNAQSKDDRPKKMPTFSELVKEMDANEDGKLSKTEVKGPLKDDFDKIDIDKDGFISKEEFAKAPKPKKDSKH